MRRVYLGSSGLLVSELCLGSWTFGRETDQETAWSLLDYFVAAGGNLIDTADAYQSGESERILGRWLKSRSTRDTVLLSTKSYFPVGDHANDVGASRLHIIRQVDASLRRLGVEHIDLFHVHCWDPATPLEETLSTLDTLVRAGKIRYIGVSNYTGWQVMKASLLTTFRGWEPLVCVQSEYNLLSRFTELELLPVCREMSLGLLCYSPLGGGWLTGKHQQATGGPAPGSRVEIVDDWFQESWARRNNDHTRHVVEAVSAVASRRGVTAAQVALNWVRTRPEATALILGARSLSQLQENMGCLDWELSPQEVSELDAASAPPSEYPYYFIEYAAKMYQRLPTRPAFRKRTIYGKRAQHGQLS